MFTDQKVDKWNPIWRALTWKWKRSQHHTCRHLSFRASGTKRRKQSEGPLLDIYTSRTYLDVSSALV